MIAPVGSTPGSLRPSACWSSGEAPALARRSRAAEDEKIVRDHAEPDPAVHALQPAIATSRQTVPVLEHTDPSFTARPPAHGASKPARARLAPAPRQGHVVHASQVRHALIRRGAETAVGDGEPRRPAEELLVTLEGRHPQVAVGHACGTDGVVGDDLVLGFLDLHELAELGELAGLPF